MTSSPFKSNTFGGRDAIEELVMLEQAARTNPTAASRIVETILPFIIDICELLMNDGVVAQTASQRHGDAEDTETDDTRRAVKDIFGAMLYDEYTASAQTAFVQTLVSMLPSKPITSSMASQPYVCEFAATEKYVCQGLGVPPSSGFILNGVSIRFFRSIHDITAPEFFNSEGYEAYTQSGIDMAEMLLRRRICDEHPHPQPDIAQRGHVGEGLTSLLNDFKAA